MVLFFEVELAMLGRLELSFEANTLDCWLLGIPKWLVLQRFDPLKLCPVLEPTEWILLESVLFFLLGFTVVINFFVLLVCAVAILIGLGMSYLCLFFLVATCNFLPDRICSAALVVAASFSFIYSYMLEFIELIAVVRPKVLN